MKKKMELREEYTGGSEYIFCGATSADHKTEKYSYADDAFYIEEGDIECFLFYFLNKHFDGNMPINYTRPEMFGEEKRRFSEHSDKNYFAVPQILNMLDDISACAELLKSDYNKAIELDFTKLFSIFYMTNNYETCDHISEADAIKKNISGVIDFYARFIARMKKLIESDPKIQYIVVSGP